jgi:hypothetical protein
MARHFESEATVPLPDRLSVRGGRIESGGRTLEVGVERQRIGRARECALVLDDATVSVIHAEVVARPTGARLLDLGSRNGVFVGEARVLEAHLQGPCEFRCGDQRLRFVLREPPAELPWAPPSRPGRPATRGLPGARVSRCRSSRSCDQNLRRRAAVPVRRRASPCPRDRAISRSPAA